MGTGQHMEALAVVRQVHTQGRLRSWLAGSGGVVLSGSCGASGCGQLGYLLFRGAPRCPSLVQTWSAGIVWPPPGRLDRTATGVRKGGFTTSEFRRAGGGP